jgi:ankyrin repeat protein
MAAPGDAEKLFDKIFYQDLEGLKKLIDEGVDVDAQDPNSGSTALMLACSFGFYEMTELLLSRGADPNISENRGTTALMAAVGVSKEMVDLLLEYNADVSIRNKEGITAFTHSIAGVLSDKVTIEVPTMLLDEGADVNEAATTGRTAGYTPLMMAANNDHRELVSFLIDRGANVNAEAGDGSTALGLATKENYSDIVTLLKENGAKH